MNLYNILKIKKGANRQEVEKAYKILAMRYHPDSRHASTDEFIKVSNAYTVMRDPYKKDFYDLFGDISLQLLLNDKESYIVTRIFDRFNICVYITTVLSYIGYFMALPIFYLLDHKFQNLYEISSVPLFMGSIAVTYIFLKVYKSLSITHGFIPELKVLLFMTVKLAVYGFEISVLSSYFSNGLFRDFWIAYVSLVSLEAVAVFNSYFLQDQNNESFSKCVILGCGYFLDLVVLFCTLTSIPAYFKPSILFTHFIWAICVGRRSQKIVGALIISPIFIYVISYSLILGNVMPKIGYGILFLLDAVLLIVIVYLLFTFFKNIPKSSYEKNLKNALSYSPV